ncbi:MAG: hypothetical protein AAF710_05095 [Planctomycetota bacterium]
MGADDPESRAHRESWKGAIGLLFGAIVVAAAAMMFIVYMVKSRAGAAWW